jgi:hypothetical protein
LFPEDESSRGQPSLIAESLAYLRAIDAAVADTLRVGVVQDFDGVAVEDGPSEVSERAIGKKEGKVASTDAPTGR